MIRLAETQVDQWRRLTWLRQGHFCAPLCTYTPDGDLVEIYPVRGTGGERRVVVACCGHVQMLDRDVRVAELLLLIESLPGSSLGGES